MKVIENIETFTPAQQLLIDRIPTIVKIILCAQQLVLGKSPVRPNNSPFSGDLTANHSP